MVDGSRRNATTLTSLTRLEARVAELKLRVAAHADEAQVGEASGATSTANWWAHATNQTRPEAHRQMRLATALAYGHEPVRVALAAGDLLVEQARVIVDAVEALPADLDAEPGGEGRTVPDRRSPAPRREVAADPRAGGCSR